MRKALLSIGILLVLFPFAFHAGITTYNRLTDDPRLLLPDNADSIYVHSENRCETRALWRALFEDKGNAVSTEFGIIKKLVPSGFIGQLDTVAPEAIEEAWEKAETIREHVGRLAASERIESEDAVTLTSFDTRRHILLTNLYLLHAGVLKNGRREYLPVLDRITRLYCSQFRGATRNDDLAGSYLFLQYIYDKYGDDLYTHAPDTYACFSDWARNWKASYVRVLKYMTLQFCRSVTEKRISPVKSVVSAGSLNPSERIKDAALMFILDHYLFQPNKTFNACWSRIEDISGFMENSRFGEIDAMYGRLKAEAKDNSWQNLAGNYFVPAFLYFQINSEIAYRMHELEKSILAPRQPLPPKAVKPAHHVS